MFDESLNRLCDILVNLGEKKALFLGRFGIWSDELKWYVQGYKIDDMIFGFQQNHEEYKILPYLKKVIFYREKFKKEVAQEPEYYKTKSLSIFDHYEIC